MGIKTLLQVTGTLGAPRMFEKSIKLTTRKISSDRGLVSMNKRALYPGPQTTLTEICDALGIAQIDKLLPHLKVAHSVHFGSDGGISKCYLEFDPANAPQDGLVFLALKTQSAVTQVSRYKIISKADAADWLETQIKPGTPLYVGATKALALAQKHDPDGQAVVLHVTEDGTDRASIDISIADAAASLSDCAGILTDVFTHFEMSPTKILNVDGNLQFGHLAVGHDKRGDNFATIYFGAQPI